MAIAVALRFVALAEPVRFDEAVTQLLFVSRAWSVAASSYPFPNNHVLYTLLAKLTAPLALDEPWAMRLPAFAAGVAIIPLTAAVGRRFVNEGAGLLGAAIAAGATQLVLYSANARGYSLVTALFLALLLGASHLRERPSRRGWMLFTLGAAAGFYAVPTMAYAYAVIGAWIVLDVATRRSRPAAELLAQFTLASVAAAALTWLLYLPVIRHAGLAALTGNKFVRPAGWWRVKYFGPPAFSDLVTTWGEPLPHAAAPALFAIAVAGVVWHHRQTRRLPSLTFAMLLGCGAVFGITRRLPFTRVWLFLLPLYCVALGAAITSALGALRARTRLRTPRVSALAASLAVALLLVSLATHAEARANPFETVRSAPRIAEALQMRLRPGDRVLAPNPAYATLKYAFVVRGMDTSYLSAPMPPAHRAFVVLASGAGQSLDWAQSHDIIDGIDLPRMELVQRYEDAELWTIECPVRAACGEDEATASALASSAGEAVVRRSRQE